MSKYELVLSKYDSIDDKYIDTVINLSEISDMNNLMKIDNFTSDLKENDVITRIREENNINGYGGKLRIRYFVDNEARYFNPIYDNDIIFNCTLDSVDVKHSNKKCVNDAISDFKHEKNKLIDLLRRKIKEKDNKEINDIFPYGGKFKDMLLDYINLGKIDVVYEQDIINEFTNYTTFRSWVTGNLNKDKPKKEKVEELKSLKNEILRTTTEEKPSLTESVRLQNLNDRFTEEDNEEFLTDEEMDSAGYGTK